MRYRWVILTLGVVAQAAYAAVLFAVPVLAPELRDEYGLSLGEIGVLFAGTSVGTVFTLLPWGLLTDRLGERTVIVFGLGGLGGSFLGAALLPRYGVLVALLTLGGASGAGVSAASGRAVLGWFAPGERGLALGIRQTAVPIGGGLASLAIPPLLGAVGLGGTLVVLGAFALAAAAVAVAGLREPPADPEAIEDLGRPLRDPRLWRLAIGSTFYVCVQIGITSFLILYLHEERGLSLAAAGAAAACVHVLGGAGRIGFGALSDRIGSRVVPLRWIGLMLAGATAAAAVLLPAPRGLVIPLLVLAGGLSMSWNGLSFTAAAELAGRRRSGAALGLQQTALAAGGAAMPVAFAFAVDAGSWRIAFALLAVLPLVGHRLLAPLS